jgi:integration host factor subunit beta
MSMVKSELVQQLVNRQNALLLKEVEVAVTHILDHMSESLAQGDRVEIRGFGSFAPRYRPPRRAHNPRTGARVFTQAKYTPHFKPGKEMRDRVEQSRLTTPLHEDTDDESDDD